MTKPNQDIGRIRVIVIDDSALMRDVLTAALSSDPMIEVVDQAADPLIAREKIKKHNPDVITLDVEMPRMNGLEFLSRLMTLRPMPVVMISTLTQAGSEATFKALEMGAVDFIAKPTNLISGGMAGLKDEIIAKVKAAARSRVRQRPMDSQMMIAGAGPLLAPLNGICHDRIIAVGGSTGAIPVIGGLLQNLPEDCCPVLITQHMPENFTGRFAQRLNGLCAIEVLEAKDGQIVKPGHAYIAPGGYQMRLMLKGDKRVLSVATGPKVNGFCPSVDVLFESVAHHAGDRAIGVILTGMGHDGAKGLLTIAKAGGATIGQDEDSCVVYGMPRLAHEMGAVQQQVAAHDMAQAVKGLLINKGTVMTNRSASIMRGRAL